MTAGFQTLRRAWQVGLAAGLALWLVGCATPHRSPAFASSSPASWHGRLALHTLAAQPQSFSAAFELQGQAQAGELRFFTPLGSTYAILRWTAQSAHIERSGQVQNFDNLDDLVNYTLGTPLPVGALFAWLAGQDQAVNGWQVDLSQQGRVQAQRFFPQPQARLKIVLEP